MKLYVKQSNFLFISQKTYLFMVCNEANHDLFLSSKQKIVVSACTQ